MKRSLAIALLTCTSVATASLYCMNDNAEEYPALSGRKLSKRQIRELNRKNLSTQASPESQPIIATTTPPELDLSATQIINKRTIEQCQELEKIQKEQQEIQEAKKRVIKETAELLKTVEEKLNEQQTLIEAKKKAFEELETDHAELYALSQKKTEERDAIRAALKNSISEVRATGEQLKISEASKVERRRSLEGHKEKYATTLDKKIQLSVTLDRLKKETAESATQQEAWDMTTHTASDQCVEQKNAQEFTFIGALFSLFASTK